eukprot:TRINITY_DN67343_c6_g1_i1.p1 TRINITY_DN67343_c6_g1~~TRINITY_DN67343_c6_g1_i1.p1  ORF type:complete len:266 (+),score=18.13 TRINITY_DN67343_c6_g1_i1:79-876(+)
MPLKTHCSNGWAFEAVNNTPIMPSTKEDEWQKDLDIGILPEMLFDKNKLSFSHEATGITLDFTAFEGLKHCIRTDGDTENVTHAKYHDIWQKKHNKQPGDTELVTHDHKIRWTFQGKYMGTFYRQKGAEQVPIKPVECEKEIDYELLKDQTQPIVFSDNIILFEDELHDCGETKLSVRTRVMPTCWFVLLRQWLRVDEVEMYLWDVRFFHKFGTDEVIIELTERMQPLQKLADPGDAPPPRLDNPDELAAKMNLVNKESFCVPLN